MKRRWVFVILALVIAATVFSRKRRSTSFELGVWLTADVRGRLVPCGCFTGQLGGLTRIATWLGAADQSTLRLDAGDALEGPEDFRRIQLGYIHQAFGKIGYAAANVGHREAQLSAAELRTLGAQSTVPFISANLLDAVSGTPLLKTHTITQRGGWRIAIVGVLDESIPADELGAGLRVERMATSIGQLLPALKKDADFLVLLAFTNQERLRSLAREFPEFCLVLGGKVTEPSQQLAMEGKTGVLFVTNQSKALGQVTLAFNAPGDVSVKSGGVMLVQTDIAESPEILRLAERYRDEIRTTKLVLDDPNRASADSVPGIRTAPGYAGSAACATCHMKANALWKRTGHAQAFQALIARKADADPNCIGCHTIGFQKTGGYRREFGATKLTGVGCESCHGPASRHIERVTAGDIEGGRLRKVGTADCATCHHGEFSRPFSWPDFWPLIQH